jgi:hypothetical protein
LACPFARGRIVREARVVRRSDVPLAGLVEHECEVFGVIIAVDGGNVIINSSLILDNYLLEIG